MGRKEEKVTCKDCGLRNDIACLVSNRIIPDLKSAACPWGRRADTIRTCDSCGRAFETLVIDMSEESPRFLCEECLNAYGTCRKCIKLNICDFVGDRSSPDMVMKQLRQGNQVIQMSVKNPDKIEIYCKRCGCWNPEDEYCMKEWGLCAHYLEEE